MWTLLQRRLQASGCDSDGSEASGDGGADGSDGSDGAFTACYRHACKPGKDRRAPSINSCNM